MHGDIELHRSPIAEITATGPVLAVVQFPFDPSKLIAKRKK